MNISAASLIATACLLAAQLVVGEPLMFKEGTLNCMELPFNVEPVRYDVHLDFPSLDSGVYDGQVDISVMFKYVWPQQVSESGDALCLSAPIYDLNTIVLYAHKRLEIHDIQVTSESYSLFTSEYKEKQRKIVERIRDEANGKIAVKVKGSIDGSKAEARPGKISIKFKGQLSMDKIGVSPSSKNLAEQVVDYIGSQFQEGSIRQIFPSFNTSGRSWAPLYLRVNYPDGLTDSRHFQWSSDLCPTIKSLDGALQLTSPYGLINMHGSDLSSALMNQINEQ